MAFLSCKPLNSIPDTKNACVFLLMLAWWFLMTITLSPPLVVCIPTSMKQGIVCKEIERQALLTLKAGLVDKAGRLSSWSDDNPNCCNWKGVSCSNHTGHVFKLNVKNPFLFQDPAFLGSSEKLRYLNLSSSSFYGVVSPYLGNLSRLEYLDFGGNTGLEVGSLQWLTGMPSLTHLNLDWLDLSKGDDDWLGAINKLPMLMELHLRGCGLSNLPMSINHHPMNVTSSLLILDLSHNGFRSSLNMPNWLFNLTRLVNLQISRCSLGAPFNIPHEIGRLVALQHLDLSDNGIGGQLPTSLGNLTNLVTLNLRNNTLEGDIHEFIDGLATWSSDHPHLETLDLSSNKLLGTLPSSLGILLNLVSLDLSFNSFWGSIPKTIGSLTALRSLVLRYNKMDGTIPKTIGKLQELEDLDLSCNQWQRQMLNESHFEKHTKLQSLQFSPTSKEEGGNLLLVMNVTQDWLPPFRGSLYNLRLDGVKMSSKKFPRWTQTLCELGFLSLDDCGISDSIPSEFWTSCPNIGGLNMSNNAISIRTTFKNIGPAAKLYALNLANNSFGNGGGGGGEIPSNIGQLFPSLQHLDLSSNSLSGELIHLHWEKMASLYLLDVSNNRLVGTIPESLGHLAHLNVLLLNDNNLEGEIPAFTNLTKLQVLNLGGNKLTCNIPPALAIHNPELLMFSLRGNMMSGTIPLKLCLLSKLQILDLAGNSFQGTIPWCLGNLSTFDAYPDNPTVGITLVLKGREYKYDAGILGFVPLVDLSNNNLSGNIPESLTNLAVMQILNLSMNHLTGEIPSNIGLLQNLEALDLSQNHLSGSIPSSISDISTLTYLYLSRNNFSGRIPSSRQLQILGTNYSSYDGNPLLCGDPLPTQCPGDGTPKDHQGEGEGEEKAEHGNKKIDIEEWGFLLSIFLGFVVGFWGVCGSLVLKASWREAYFGYLVGVKDNIIVAVIVNVARLRRKMGISE